MCPLATCPLQIVIGTRSICQASFGSAGSARKNRRWRYNADAYAAAPDEASAHRLLVERVETIIAEEQQLFWQSQAKGGAEQASVGTEQAKGGAEQGKGEAEQATGGAEQEPPNCLTQAHERHLPRMPIEMTAIFIKPQQRRQRGGGGDEGLAGSTRPYFDFDPEAGIKGGSGWS